MIQTYTEDADDKLGESRYKQYKKNNWRFWQWNNSQEHQDYLDVKRAYEEMKSSLELEERRINEVELKVIRLTKE